MSEEAVITLTPEEYRELVAVVAYQRRGPTYEEGLRIISDDTEHLGGGNSEYERGQLELLADLFAVPNVERGARVEQIADDIRARYECRSYLVVGTYHTDGDRWAEEFEATSADDAETQAAEWAHAQKADGITIASVLLDGVVVA